MEYAALDAACLLSLFDNLGLAAPPLRNAFAESCRPVTRLRGQQVMAGIDSSPSRPSMESTSPTHNTAMSLHSPSSFSPTSGGSRPASDHQEARSPPQDLAEAKAAAPNSFGGGRDMIVGSKTSTGAATVYYPSGMVHASQRPVPARIDPKGKCTHCSYVNVHAPFMEGMPCMGQTLWINTYSFHSLAECLMSSCATACNHLSICRPCD